MEGFMNLAMKKVASWKDDPSVQISWDLALEKLTMLLHLLTVIIGGFHLTMIIGVQIIRDLALERITMLRHLLDGEMDIEGFLKQTMNDLSVQRIWDMALEKMKKVESWKDDPSVQRIWDMALEKVESWKDDPRVQRIWDMALEEMKKVESWKDDPSVQRIWDMALEKMTMQLRFLWSFLLDISKQLYHLIDETRGDTLRLWGLPLALALLCLFYWSRAGRRTMKAPGRGGVRMPRSKFEENPKNYFRGLRAK